MSLERHLGYPVLFCILTDFLPYFLCTLWCRIDWIICKTRGNMCHNKGEHPKNRRTQNMKNNNFAEEYAQELAIKAQYKEAEKAGSEEGKETARKAYQELEEQIAARGNTYARIYRLYSEAKERGNEYIDLNDTIWEDKVKPLIDSLREYGIEKFTFSSTWSSAVEIAWLFTQNGCRLEGLVEINSQYKETWGSEYKKAHGYLFSIN